MITWIYFLICMATFSLITWVMIRSIKNTHYPPNNDDDGGGLPGGNDFPVIDLPPGGKYEDWFVDRWYDSSHTKTSDTSKKH